MPNSDAMDSKNNLTLFQPFTLPGGVVLKNRVIKAAMSDSLGDGRGNPTDTQVRLYQRWAEGGAAAMIIGEVQCSPLFAEKPGNLVLTADAELEKFRALAASVASHGAQLWCQLGHAGAMAHPPISKPKGPSAIDVPGLSCDALKIDEIRALPAEFARTAALANQLGFGGVQIHSAHGFLLSQFLSPLFNQRNDEYGGSIESRMRLLIEVIRAVRDAVDTQFVVSVKLNATDQLEGGFAEDEALQVIHALDKLNIDFIDISGGTYFPGAPSSSDRIGSGPYFVEFANRARAITSKPLMVTGGFKTCEHAEAAVSTSAADMIGLARALVLEPALPSKWQRDSMFKPNFPSFESPPEGGITAWYTMRLTQIGEERENQDDLALLAAIDAYHSRDERRVIDWNNRFSNSLPAN